MTIWQKRLLKFSLQVLGVIILIAVIALFLYYHLYFKKDNLIKYVPKSAIFYSTFRLNDDLLKNKLIKNFLTDYNLENLDFDILNHFVAYNSAFAIIPDFEAETLKLDYLFIFNLKQNPLAFEQYSSLIEEHNLAYDLLTYQTLERDILIISNSENVIKQVQEIAWQGKPSLVQKVDLVFNLNKFSLDYLAKIYIDVENLADNLDKIKNLQIKLLLASLKADKIKELFLGLEITENNLLVKSSNNNFNTPSFLIEKIPQDFVLNFSFQEGGNKIKQIYDLLREYDSHTFGRVEKNKQYLEKLYEFDFEKDILELFAGQTQFVIDQDKNYLFVISLDEISDLEEKLAKLEVITKQYLAVKYPVKQAKQLPDYTYISQIIKNPNIPDFELEGFYDVNLHYLNYEREEFAYYYTSDVLFFANSSQIVRNLIKNQNLIDVSEISSCYKQKSANFSYKNAVGSQNLLINGQYLSSIWPYFSQIKYLVVSEQLVNGKFWLCLE